METQGRLSGELPGFFMTLAVIGLGFMLLCCLPASSVAELRVILVSAKSAKGAEISESFLPTVPCSQPRHAADDQGALWAGQQMLGQRIWAAFSKWVLMNPCLFPN